MKKLLYILLFFLCVNSYAQTFEIKDGDTINLTDSNGKKQGFWTITNKIAKKPGYRYDQVVEEGYYKDDKKNGKWKEYYENGNPKMQCNYVAGEPNGYTKLYYESGFLREEGVWRNYRWVGMYKMYYESGQLQYFFHFNKEGVRIQGQIYFYENGTVMIEGQWENGQENGKLTEYYDNGDIKTEKLFSEGGEIDYDNIKNFRKVHGSVIHAKF